HKVSHGYEDVAAIEERTLQPGHAINPRAMLGGESKLVRCLRIRARQGTCSLAAPTPHDRGWPPRSPPTGRFQLSPRGTARKYFEPAYLCARGQPCTRRAASWRLPPPLRG